MSGQVILASTSQIRSQMLQNACVDHTTTPARIDEDMIKQGLLAEGAPARDVADKLAELKSLKISMRDPEALVIGSDQVLDHNGTLLSKPKSPQEAEDQLAALSGGPHKLHSAAVISLEGRPIWRHLSTATLVMHSLSSDFIADYVARNWGSIQYSVGGYKIEEEGVRLFAQIIGDHFTIQGMPLVPLLSYLAQRGTLAL